MAELEIRADLKVFGSYRRGESPCSDVDFALVFEKWEDNEKLDFLVRELKDRGIVLHELRKDQNKRTPLFGKRQSLTEGWWKDREDSDSFKFRLVMCLAKVRDRVRRIDLFCCTKRSKAPLSLYLTGNVWFNRRMREYSEKEKRYFLCNSAFGKIETNGSVTPVDVETEEDIFKVLELDYVEPKDRNY